ncbi:phage tail protein [Shewanella sp.]|uniref:phage tail protein n=1 Tax=Shewanella sp. TaxID=50422 RepID=UPI001B69D316|nr:phage tail protein [Shewanella sp.]MBP6518318.1 phage tail protein [Shewanella sp.]
MKYFALLTKLGENLLAQATALGTKLELTHMSVGDGGGALPTPDTNQTKLIAEKRRAAINTLFIDEKNKNQIVAEQIIPESEGGWWIREIGLFDKAGNLIAIANCPETYKPQLAEGSGRTQSIRIVLIVSHTESVTLKIDPSVVLATRDYVNTEITVVDKKIDALSAQTKLDLNKKIDKANISGVKGDDNDKVPSLHLFTVEIGKLAAIGYSYSKVESDNRFQPKGNYQLSGDYATNTALNNGLGLKFDKAGGAATGTIMAENEIGAKTDGAHISLITSDKVRGAHIASRKDGETNYLRHNLPTRSGTFMQLGDYGFGGDAGYEALNEQQTIDKFKSGVSQIWRGNTQDTKYSFKFATNFLAYTSDTFFNLAVGTYGVSLGSVRITAGVSTQGVNSYKIIDLYSNLNVSPDRNGNLKLIGSSDELSDYPVGSPIPWTQATPPTGYLICYGQSFNKTTYPLLAKAYPSGTLPDLRAEFIRGLDINKNVDNGRVVLSAQASAYERHSHARNGDGLEEWMNSGIDGNLIGEYYNGSGGRSYIRKYSNTGTSGSNETRPRNIAFLYIVRAA